MIHETHSHTDTQAMDSLTMSPIGSTSDYFTAYSTTAFQCKILRQASKEKARHGNGSSGQERAANSSYTNACIAFSTTSATPILYYICNPDGTPHMESVANMANDLVSLTSGLEPLPSNLEHRDCSNAHRTLGMWPAPNGSAKKQNEASLARRATDFYKEEGLKHHQ